MYFSDYLKGDVVVITLAGKMLGGDKTTLLRGRIQEYLNLGKRRIILDLSDVDRINSVGLGVLTSAQKSINQAGGEMILANIVNIESLLSLTKLINVFSLADSKAEAMNRLSKSLTKPS